MKILHWMKKENSGLARTTIEIAEYEEKKGHRVVIKQPSEDMPIYGSENGGVDIHCVHSQLHIDRYHDKIPKVMWMHGEPLSSVANGVSMKAIVDLAPLMDCFIAMRKEEMAIWNSIRKTWYIPKGIDLNKYKPIPGVLEQLSGEPAVLYCENWRGLRNPLYLCAAMEIVHKKLPNARLHLFNCQDKKMEELFHALGKNNKWWPFLRTIGGHVEDINMLYNKCHILVSCLFPLYARGIEALGAGKAFICPGYRENGWPYQCDLQPESMAEAIIKCWENYDDINYRQYAARHHDVSVSTDEAIKVYERYV